LNCTFAPPIVYALHWASAVPELSTLACPRFSQVSENTNDTDTTSVEHGLHQTRPRVFSGISRWAFARGG